jgi:hypothetical protein
VAVRAAVQSDLEEDNRSIVRVWAGLGLGTAGFCSMESVNVVSVTSEDYHLILPEGGSTFRRSTRLHGVTP